MHADQNARRRYARRGATLIASLALALLAACGGGGGTSGGDGTTGGGTESEGATGTTGVHLAGLGRLAGASVRVELLNAPSLAIATATTDANGHFSLTLPAAGALDDFWALVIVTGGNETDADADGVTDATPTAFNGVLRSLVQTRWLRERSLSVSAVSDAMYLSVAGAVNDVPAEALKHALERAAYLMLKSDIDGDAALSYDDILSFNASRARDRAALDFDYTATVLAPQGSDGTSLAAKYLRGDGAMLGAAVNEAFGRIIKPVLPSPDKLTSVAITLKSGLGGSVSSAGLGNTVLGGAFGTYVHRMERTADPLIVTAVPDADFVFNRWTGCPELIPGEPQSCRITPNDVHVVTAQFAVAQRRLAAGLTGEVVLDAEPGRMGVAFSSPTDMVLTTRASDTEMRAIIDTLGARMIATTGIFARPLVRVDDRRNRAVVPNPDGGEDLYQGIYRVADIRYADAYDAITLSMDEAPLSLDDLTAITIPDPTTGNLRTVKLPNTLMRGYIPGPAPRTASARSCGSAGSEPVYRYAADGSGRVEAACLSSEARLAESGSHCPISQREIDLVDGRRYCLVDGSWESAHWRHARELAAELAEAPATGGLVKVGSRSSTAIARPAKAPLQQTTVGREVFLSAYGRAYDLGHGQFLTNNPEATGLALIEIEGQPEVITNRKELRRTVSATCRLNTFASGCQGLRGGRLIKTQTIDPFPPLPGGGGFQAFSLQDIELTFPKLPALKIIVKVQVNIDARNSGSGSYAAPLAGEVRMSGNVTVTPSLGVKLILMSERDVLAKSGKPTPGSTEKVEPKKRVFSIDFARYIPKVGAVMQGDIDFTIGVDLIGTLEVDNKLQMPIITRYDVDAAAGLRCSEAFSILGVSVPNPADCTTTSKFDVIVRPTIQYRYRMQGTANIILEPYVEVAVSAGIREGFERMASVAARGFVQAEAILQSPVIQITNIPQLVAEQGGKRTCVDGGLEARANLWYGYRLYGKLTTDGTLIGKIITLTKEFPFAEQKWLIASWGWDLSAGEKLDPPKNVSVGLFINPVTEPQPCTGGSRPTEASREIPAGMLEMQDGSFIATSTRKLVMQADGNLVMYDYDAPNATERSALFASDTSGIFNMRALFQSDGNLVIYDLRDRQRWASRTNGYPSAVLTLKDDGDVQILRSTGSYPIWGQILTYGNGGLTLRLGDKILTPTRELSFQAHDGNLVLYKVEKGELREALWSSGTNGMTLGSNAEATFQRDGNFVVYDGNGRARWSSGTGDKGAIQLALQRDGNLVIYAAGQSPLWATGTGGR